MAQDEHVVTPPDAPHGQTFYCVIFHAEKAGEAACKNRHAPSRAPALERLEKPETVR